MPKIAIFAAISIAAPFRTAVWTVALLWMGTACFLNSSLRTYSLPLYGPVLFGDDTSGACFRSRPNLGEYLRMASALPSHSLWWLRYSMEDRTGVGQVLSLTPRYWPLVPITRLNVCFRVKRTSASALIQLSSHHLLCVEDLFGRECCFSIVRHLF